MIATGPFLGHKHIASTKHSAWHMCGTGEERPGQYCQIRTGAGGGLD